jgi:hypothetical protein
LARIPAILPARNASCPYFLLAFAKADPILLLSDERGKEAEPCEVDRNTTLRASAAAISRERAAGAGRSFGGGKTHTMLAVYHLARVADLKRLAGLAPPVDAVGVKTRKRPKVAVFVGSSKGTDVSLNLKEGPQVHTLWGYIA